MQGRIGGRLQLTIVEANLSRDTEMFGKMDPYCMVVFDQKKGMKTHTAESAGTKPKWNWKTEFPV